jgi:hypothetical protein
MPRRARILSTGPVYSTINRTDCLSWPSEEIKGQAGMGPHGWAAFYPRIGDEGDVIWASRHPNDTAIVYLLEVRGYYVPIGERGLELLDGKPGPPPVWPQARIDRARS